MPRRRELVEGGGLHEHAVHILDRARVPLADGPARTLPQRASSGANSRRRASRNQCRADASWSKEEATKNIHDISLTAPVFQPPIGLRGGYLDGRQAPFHRRASMNQCRADTSWLKEEAASNISDISSTAPVSHLPMGLRGYFLTGRREAPTSLSTDVEGPVPRGRELVEGLGPGEHVPHILDRARLPPADGPARTLPQRASRGADLFVDWRRGISAARTRAG